MSIPKFLSTCRSTILWKKISYDFNSTALFATNFLVNYGREMKYQKYFFVIERSYTMPAGVPGSGAGKGGGSGGSVIQSGGGLGRYGAAQETGYFLKKQREQLAKIKKMQESEQMDPSQKGKK